MAKKAALLHVQASGVSISPRERVKIVLQRLYAGNQSEMAKALACSHVAVSQIVRERRGVGARILRAMANLPGVSPEWAILGVGRPPRVLGQSDPTQLLLPVFTSLEFALSDYPTRVPTSIFEQVVPVEYNSTRAIFQIPDDHACVPRADGRLKAGDHILLETDRRIWTEDPSFLDGRLCVVAKIEGDKLTAELVRVDVTRGKPRVSENWPIVRCDRTVSSQIAANASGKNVHRRSMTEMDTDVEMLRKHGKTTRPIQLETSSPARGNAEEKRTGSKGLDLKEIVAASIRFTGNL